MDNRTHSVGDMRFPPIWHKNSAKISPKANIFMFYNLLPLICFWVKELGVLTAEIFLCLWGNTFDRNSSPSQFWLFLNHISGVSFLLICHCHNSSISPWHVNSPLHDRSKLCHPLAWWQFWWAQGRIGSNESRACHGLSLVRPQTLRLVTQIH